MSESVLNVAHGECVIYSKSDLLVFGNTWFSGQASSRGVATVPANVYTVITTSCALYRADSWLRKHETLNVN